MILKHGGTVELSNGRNIWHWMLYFPSCPLSNHTSNGIRHYHMLLFISFIRSLVG